jgi:hypothetical protein
MPGPLPPGVLDGYVFRPVNRGDQVQGEVFSEKVVWQLLRPYAAAAGVPGFAPHDCRRTAAKLSRAADGELEQIQTAAGPRLGTDNGAVPWHKTGPLARMQRRDQAEGSCINNPSGGFLLF